jgi:hypothetical protein
MNVDITDEYAKMEKRMDEENLVSSSLTLSFDQFF